MTTSREQFEDAFEELTGCESDEYPDSNYVDDMWAMWQASRQRIEVESPELLTTPVKQFEFERDCQWKEAISKAGIKVKGA